MIEINLNGEKIQINKYCELTEIEANKIKELANFTGDQMDYFNMKLKDFSNIRISMDMHVSPSKVSRLAKEVKAKISRLKA